MLEDNDPKFWYTKEEVDKYTESMNDSLIYTFMLGLAIGSASLAVIYLIGRYLVIPMLPAIM